MRTRTGKGALALAVVGLFALSACSSSSTSTNSSKSSSGGTSSSATTGASTSGTSPSPGKAINVLAVVDTTGPLATYGKQELAGLQAAAAYYNANGGMGGHQVSVHSVTDNGDPATAVTALVKELASNPSMYTMIYPGETPTTTAAMIPVIAKSKVLAISSVDGLGYPCRNVQTCPTQFGVESSPLGEVETSGRWLKSKGITKVGILSDAEAFGKTEQPVAKQHFNSLGIQTSLADYPSSATDLTTQVNALKSSGAQAMFVEGLGQQPSLALAARARLNWNVPVLFDPSAAAIDVTKLVTPALVKNLYLTVPKCQDSALPSPGIVQLKKYAPSGSQVPIPCIVIGTGWDAMVDLDAAITQSHSISTSDLAKALETLPPSAQKNPLYISIDAQKFSPTDHDNQGLTIDSDVVIPASPVSAWQNQVSP